MTKLTRAQREALELLSAGEMMVLDSMNFPHINTHEVSPRVRYFLTQNRLVQRRDPNKGLSLQNGYVISPKGRVALASGSVPEKPVGGSGGMQRPRARRLSLTKTQAAAGPGAELLSLLQTVTEDGALADEEIAALQEWLEENRDADLPSIQFLTGTVMKIMADGRITDEERAELYQAVEKVLPPEARKEAKASRIALERAEMKDLLEQERRSWPVKSFDFMVAGSSYEGRPAIIEEFAYDGDPILLKRDRANAHSRNAVAVLLKNSAQIGFVPEADAVRMARLLDSGHKFEARVKKILSGRRGPIPVVVADIYAPDSQVEGLKTESEVAAPRMPESTSAGSGSARVVGLVVLLVAVLVAVAYLAR